MDGAQFEISVVHYAPAMAATPLSASFLLLVSADSWEAYGARKDP